MDNTAPTKTVRSQSRPHSATSGGFFARIVILFIVMMLLTDLLPQLIEYQFRIYEYRGFLYPGLFSVFCFGLIFILSYLDLDQKAVDNATHWEGYFQKLLDRESSYSDSKVVLSNRLKAIDDIDHRIDLLRKRSGAMLLAIAVLLIAASLIVIFAGSLTNLDISAASNVDRIQSGIDLLETKIGRLASANSLLTRISDPSTTPENRKSLQTTLDSLTSRSDGIPGELNATSVLIDVERDRLITLKTLLSEAWEKEIKSERGYNDTRYLIATAITRVGVVLLIVFLVQILIGLYRYNTRLATFYMSRRDFLQVWDGSKIEWDALEKVFAPNVEFGKEPKHPIDDFVKDLIAKIPGFGGPSNQANDQVKPKTPDSGAKRGRDKTGARPAGDKNQTVDHEASHQPRGATTEERG